MELCKYELRSFLDQDHKEIKFCKKFLIFQHWVVFGGIRWKRISKNKTMSL